MGKSDYKAEALAYKYAEIPEQNVSKKKKKKATPKKARHKHVYENALVETSENFFSSFPSSEIKTSYCLVSYCPECGKIGGKYVKDDFVNKFLPSGSVFTFGYIPCPLMGSVKTYNECIDEAKKTYRVFHQKSFDMFKQKYLEI